MASADHGSFSMHVVSPPDAKPRNPLHRIKTVRLQQEVSLRSAARNTGSDVRQLKSQEQETADLRISDLHRWQKALDVPLQELLAEPDDLLAPSIQDRARMIRLMKTAVAIRERAPSEKLRILAETLITQLLEVMPELREVGPWHNFGQRRSLNEYGRVVDRQLPDNMLLQANDFD